MTFDLYPNSCRMADKGGRAPRRFTNAQQGLSQTPNKLFETVFFSTILRRGRQRGSANMTEQVTAHFDEETLSFDVSDAALELAGSKCWEGPAGSFTVAFCSGIDTCPSLPA